MKRFSFLIHSLHRRCRITPRGKAIFPSDASFTLQSHIIQASGLSRMLLVLFTIVSVATGLILLSPHFVLAASRARLQMQQTCASSPSASTCDQQDPIQQGCSSDAVTVVNESITDNGATVGALQVRHSQRCNSYWGRVLSFGRGTAEVALVSPFIETDSSPTQDSYSNMLFGFSPSLQGVIHLSAAHNAEASYP